MQLSISEFKDIMLSKSGGKPLSKIQNFYSMLFQAMLKLRKEIDPPSAIKTVQITNAIYSDVHQYSLPTDIVLNGMIALRAITPDTNLYDFSNINARQALIESKYGKTGRYAIRYINGIPYILIDIETTTPATINACDSTSSNGTFAAIGATSDIAVDTLQKVSGAGAISFAVGSGTTNGVDITGMASGNYSTYNDMLAYVFLPTLADINGVRLALGQSSSAYYVSPLVTTDMYGNALKVGWNLIKTVRSTYSIGVGAPSFDGVTYARFEVVGNITNAAGGFRLDSIVANIGAIYEIDYYSELGFKTAAGTYIVKPTLDSDIIALSTGDELDLFIDQLLEVLSSDIKQTGAKLDIGLYGGTNLAVAYERFRFKYPSLRQLVVTDYASRPNIH